jgi:hypothetical protein
MVTNVILGAVLVALLVIFGLFYRYSRTDEFRRGDLRRATLSLLMTIGPFFGVHPKRIEPEPATISTPKDETDDPLAERARIRTPELRDPGKEKRPPQL